MNLTANLAPPVEVPPPLPKALPRRRPRRSRWPFYLFGFILLGGIAAGVVATFFWNKSSVANLLWEPARRQPLRVVVVEKGTLESTDNRDIICRVKAGTKGTFASTIKWVIDDGSLVNKGQLLMELDDSALQENYKTQSIVVEKARAEWVKADEEYTITVKQNEADLTTALGALRVAELDLDKFLGFREEPALIPLGALVGGFGTLLEKGEYRSQHDDVSSRLKQAESDLEAYRERAAWAERQLKLGNYTPYQTRAEVTKMQAAQDNLEKLRKEKYILETFTRERTLTDLRSKFEAARIGHEKALFQAKSKEVQADSDRRTKLSVLNREQDRLDEIEEQIQACKILAPQSGMVVYAKTESSRYSSSNEGMIMQGMQVKEGQKLMRIPDLRKMQVNTKVHESLVARIRGDDRRSTGAFDSLRASMLLYPVPFVRLMSQSEYSLGIVRDHVRDKEYYVAEKGQRASVRVDAYPDRVFEARVRSVAAVASSTDWGSDVKTYQTLVVIEQAVEGLKPDMNAEVTIHIDDNLEPVLTIPIAAVVGGTENGGIRTVYVRTADGPKEREVTLGKFNDRTIEVCDGLREGEEVLTNPKAFLGDKAKTREDGADAPKSRGTAPVGAEKTKGTGTGGSDKKKAPPTANP